MLQELDTTSSSSINAQQCTVLGIFFNFYVASYNNANCGHTMLILLVDPLKHLSETLISIEDHEISDSLGEFHDQVKLEQGLQVHRIYKEHSSRQFILDDFAFYKDRQKRIQ